MGGACSNASKPAASSPRKGAAPAADTAAEAKVEEPAERVSPADHPIAACVLKKYEVELGSAGVLGTGAFSAVRRATLKAGAAADDNRAFAIKARRRRFVSRLGGSIGVAFDQSSSNDQSARDERTAPPR